MSKITELTGELREKLPGLEIKAGEPMAAHTSFRIGGPSALMLLPASAEELTEALRLLHARGVRPLLLGAGTNVLAPDEGLPGVTVLTRGVSAIEQTGPDTVMACCGALLSRLAVFAQERGLAGLEFAHGIPGTVGGGVFMNAGAYGGEIRQVAVRTTVILPDGALKDYAGEEQGFRYRGSAFQAAKGTVLRTEFRLTPGDPAEIRARMQDLAQRRRSKQPLELPSAGSAFKRPEGHYAGALIEAAGLKGFRIGGAAVSEKHAGFVVNLGGATAADVRALLAAVQQRVFEQSGVMLEPEIRLL